MPSIRKESKDAEVVMVSHRPFGEGCDRHYYAGKSEGKNEMFQDIMGIIERELDEHSFNWTHRSGTREVPGLNHIKKVLETEDFGEEEYI